MTLPKSYNGSYAPANHSGSDTVDDAFIEDILSLQHNVISAVQNLWGINERTKHALARRTAEETSLRERASRKIRDDYDKSRPYQQFQSQVTREERRLRDGTKDSKLRFDLKHIQELRTQAEQLVVSKWKEQGIWIDSWNSVPDEDAKWKHEVSAKVRQIYLHRLLSHRPTPINHPKVLPKLTSPTR